MEREEKTNKVQRALKKIRQAVKERCDAGVHDFGDWEKRENSHERICFDCEHSEIITNEEIRQAKLEYRRKKPCSVFGDDRAIRVIHWENA